MEIYPSPYKEKTLWLFLDLFFPALHKVQLIVPEILALFYSLE